MVTQESESGLDQLQKGKKLEWETSWIVRKFWAWVSPGAESILSLSWAHLQLQKCKEKKKKNPNPFHLPEQLLGVLFPFQLDASTSPCALQGFGKQTGSRAGIRG